MDYKAVTDPAYGLWLNVDGEHRLKIQLTWRFRRFRTLSVRLPPDATAANAHTWGFDQHIPTDDGVFRLTMPTPEVLIPALLGNIHFRQRHRLTLQPCTAENLADPNALIDEDVEEQVLQEISAEQGLGLQADLDEHMVQPLMDLINAPI